MLDIKSTAPEMKNASSELIRGLDAFEGRIHELCDRSTGAKLKGEGKK